MSNLQKNYAIQLDGLRCFAVSAVIICHWMQYSFMSYVPFGSSGVNLFFVLSGYLITSILLRQREAVEENRTTNWISIKQFYLRRVLRIFPIYFLIIAVFWIINFDRCRALIGWLLSYTMNIYITLPGNNYGSFGHFWSLAVEEQFYIFFPFIILFIPRKHLLTSILAIGASGVLVRVALFFCHIEGNALYSLTPCVMDAFGAGALLSWLAFYRKDKLIHILKKRSLWFLMLGIFILITYIERCSGSREGRTVFERLSCSILCFWIVGRASQLPFTGFVKYLTENKIAVYTGRISYGIYLYHVFVPEIFRQVFSHFKLAFPYQEHSVLINTPFYLLATFIMAILSWIFVEKYMMKLKARIGY